MGVDIFYHVNHDLPTDSSEVFLKEFSKRVNNNFEIYNWSHPCEEKDKEYIQITEYGTDDNGKSYENKTIIDKPIHSRFMKDGKWYVCYDSEYGDYPTFEGYFPNPKHGIRIHYSNNDLDIELELAKKTLMIWKIKNNWDNEIDCYRWYTMNDFFSDDIEFAKSWKEKLILQVKDFLTPVFHCSEVLLVKDSSSYEHETLTYEYLVENGESIEEALLRNSEFKEPCAILRNDESFGHDTELSQPFYIFNF